MGTATATTRLREAAARLVARLRGADRYLRLRAAIVGSWAALSLLTAVAACPPAGVGNGLGGEARVLRESFVGGAQVLVRNDSGDVWRDVVVTIDGAWRYRHATLRPQDQIVVPTTRFVRGDDALRPDHRPQRLEVECDRGRHAFDVR